MLYVTGVHLRDITNTSFVNFALEFESFERLLSLFSLFGGLRTAILTTLDYFNYLVVYGDWQNSRGR